MKGDGQGRPRQLSIEETIGRFMKHGDEGGSENSERRKKDDGRIVKGINEEQSTEARTSKPKGVEDKEDDESE